MNLTKRYTEATLKTATNLRSVAQSMLTRNLSRLSLPEMEAVIEQVARLVPAGNVSGMILSGLARLPERKLPAKTAKRDVNLLFQGVEQTLDQAVYGAFFAGPAAVIGAYQSLLRLAGKDLDEAFPEGLWQFYVDYAMREDTARHATETQGFDTLLNQHQIRLSTVDRISAWIMAAVYCLHQYEALLANEWREPVYTSLLTELTRPEPEADRYAQLYREWEKQRPYGRGADARASETYPVYRRRKFDQFLAGPLSNLRADLRDKWIERVRQAQAQDLPAYQRQMSILAYLEPGPYGETRTPIPLAKAHLGLIHHDCYYLIPACSPGTDRPATVEGVRAQVAALLADVAARSTRLTPVAEMKRPAWASLRRKLAHALLKELNALRLAPILLNCDMRPRHPSGLSPAGRSLPLAELRQAERGIGDHALTLFDTGETIVFDQSHIFFDGAWGAALAEIMTQEALAWANYLHSIEGPPTAHKPPHALVCHFQAVELELIRQAPAVTSEASAETDQVNLPAILKLRRLFKQRNDLLQLTVNDLLILYRAIHAATYQPDPDLVAELKNLTRERATRPAILSALAALDPARQVNPAIVMPVDASRRAPRDRLYPVTFEVPLSELDLLNLHERVLAALMAYKQARGDRTQIYAEFDQLQRTYLTMLAGFGAVLGKVKEMAMVGETTSMSALKLLAHLPTPLQRLLDGVPDRFDVLNDLIKGREVFSNVGAVVSTSTLTRFISAKDDNDHKTLVWGVMTDAQGVMRITLRDFRPHVGLLAACGRKDLATRITQHYLETYAQGLNQFIHDLQLITQASRETRMKKPGLVLGDGPHSAPPPTE